MSVPPPDDPTDARTRDADIVELVGRGAHSAAFDRLLERYEQRLFRLCLSFMRDRALAEDLTQEALVRIWKALPRYDGRASLSTWVYTIARNRCLTALQRRRDEDSLSDPQVALEAEMVSSVAPEGAEPGDGLLRDLVEALPERYRRTLALYYYEDRSIQEVACMLAMPEGTVKTNLYRARGLLLGSLEKLGLAHPDLWQELTA